MALREPRWPRNWYFLSEAKLVGDGLTSFRLLGRDLVVLRARGEVVALGGRCLHQGAYLAEGQRIGDDRIRCPFHGWEYDLEGACRKIPGCAAHSIGRRLARYPVAERHGLVFVYLGEEPTYPLPFFDEGSPADFVAGRVQRLRLGVPWYVAAANAFDFSHFQHHHERRLLCPPTVDEPQPGARRVTLRYAIEGRSAVDRALAQLSKGETVLSYTSWRGSLALAEARFGAVTNRMLFSLRPVDDTTTDVDLVVYVRRSGGVRRLLEPAVVPIVSHLSALFFQREGQSLRGVRFNPETALPSDAPLARFTEWLIAQTSAPDGGLDPIGV